MQQATRLTYANEVAAVMEAAGREAIRRLFREEEISHTFTGEVYREAVANLQLGA